jgi:membrane fusion protein (multidrug efflux system)
MHVQTKTIAGRVTFAFPRPFHLAALVLLPVAAILSGCGQKAQGPPPPPPEVGVTIVHSQAVPLTRELVGRLSATRSADVRARVAGVLQKRL